MTTMIGRPAAPIRAAGQFRAKQLSALLRSARRRMPPPGGFGSQRRIGVTQEQAADLLGIDARNYQNLEHGRLRHPEPDVLERLAKALNLTPAEREALFYLAADHSPPSPAWAERDMTVMRELIDFLPGLPALATDMAFDILLWNKPLTQWLIDPATIEPLWRNALLWPFTAQARAAMPGIEREYPLLVGRVRLDYLCDGGRNPALADVAARLRRIPEAAKLWNDGALALDPAIQTLTVHHRVHGNREVRTLSTVLPQQGLRLLIFTPVEQPPAQDTKTQTPRIRIQHGPGRSRSAAATAVGTAPR
ncbi:MAG: helix-turn-helix domain-containing protein [Sciscionella sp.]